MNLPNEFSNRMKNLLGDEYDAFLRELSNPAVKAYRVNGCKISREEFEKITPFGSERVPYTSGGYYLTMEKAGNHPYHHAGLVYIQEPAAMMPMECIDIEPSWAILDMCAAPGGKSTKAAEALKETGVIVSNEISNSRCKVLQGNIERMGIKNAVVTCLDSKRIAEYFPKCFDMIIVDAPCSGEGMFRKEQAAIDDWSVENVKSCALRQQEILNNAALCLKDGGIIVYSTCTYAVEENEMTVDAFLQSHPEFSLEMPNQRVMEYTCDGVRFDGCKTENIHLCRRLYPHKNRGEGQFAAVIRNTLQGVNVPCKAKKQPQKLPQQLKEFLDDTLNGYNAESFYITGDKVTYFTPDFDFDKSRVYNYGVTVGSIKNNYFAPHHQFFAADFDFKRKIEFNGDEQALLSYLRGETFDTPLNNGWAQVTVAGGGIGGVKVTGGTAKNHYPKGLRLL